MPLGQAFAIFLILWLQRSHMEKLGDCRVLLEGTACGLGAGKAWPLLLQRSLHPPCYSSQGSPEADIAEDRRKAWGGEARGE